MRPAKAGLIEGRKSMGDVIELEVECAYRTGVEVTRRVCEVASMFGLGVDPRKVVQVVPRVKIPVGAGSVVFITGASGGGKSTLLRLIGEGLRGREGVQVVEFGGTNSKFPPRRVNSIRNSNEEERISDAKPQAAEGAIVEEIGGRLEEAVRWLSLAGLNDAFVMLRKERELSDGQRYRFKLAKAIAMSESQNSKFPPRRVNSIRNSKGEGEGDERLTVVLADEFGATLDRLTAGVIARNVRKWVDRQGDVCFVGVSTHDDLLESLEPDVLVVAEVGEGIAVHCREREGREGLRDAGTK